MISVSSQGPGRPFLLTKYRGGFFSPRGGPVFGRVLYRKRDVSSEGAPGQGATSAEPADGNPKGLLKPEAVEGQAVTQPDAQEGGFEEKNVKNTAPASHEARPKDTCHMRTKN